MSWKCWLGMHKWVVEQDYIETGNFAIRGVGGKNSLSWVTKERIIHQTCSVCGDRRVVKEPYRK